MSEILRDEGVVIRSCNIIEIEVVSCFYVVFFFIYMNVSI